MTLFEFPAAPAKTARIPRCIFHSKLNRQPGIFHLQHLDMPRGGSAHLDLPEARKPVHCFVIFVGAVEKCLDQRVACKSMPLIIATNAFIVEIVSRRVIAHKQTMGDVFQRRGCIVDPHTFQALVDRMVLRFNVDAWPLPDCPTEHYAASLKRDFPRNIRETFLRQRSRVRKYLQKARPSFGCDPAAEFLDMPVIGRRRSCQQKINPEANRYQYQVGI